MSFIIIRGPLGCGKSTISKALAKSLNAKHIEIDKIVDNPALITQEQEEGYISQKNFIAANDIAIKEAKESLDAGNHVIFDGNFYWKSQIEDLIKKLDFPSQVFTLKASLDLCINRDAQRKVPHGIDAAKVVYAKTTEFTFGTVIDVDRSVQECVDEIITLSQITQ